jgi:hypothetical protein
LDVDRRIITESKKEMKDNEFENKKLALEKERITEQINQEHRIELAKMKKKEEDILSKIDETAIVIEAPPPV